MENQVNDPSIENKIDEGALEKETKTPAKKEKTDTSAESTAALEQIGKASLEELVVLFEQYSQSDKWYEFRDLLQKIMDQFDGKFNELLQAKKKEFLEEGGNSIDFFFKPPAKENYDKCVREYRQKKRKHYQYSSNEN